jgi:ketosteroid isomerase-like protein
LELPTQGDPIRIHTLIAPLLLGVALTVSSQVQAQASPVGDAQAVMAKAVTSFNARDYAAYEPLFTNDVEVYTGVYTPLRFVGKAQWMGFIHGLDNFAASSYDQRQPECRAYNNDVVLCNAYFVFTTTTKAGVTAVQTGRESSALVKSGGKWLIANQHYSAMF